MKICIRSASEKGKKACEIIEKNFNYETVCYMEEINYISGNKVGEIPIFSQYKVLEMYKDNIIDKIIVPGNLNVYTLLNIQRELHSLDISRDDIIIIPTEIMERTNIYLSEDEREQLIKHHEFNYMKYLEFHVADHCNLNCDNCTHFSSFVKKESFAEYQEVRNDFIRLKELVDNINTIRILGGECLLNPDLDKYIIMVKEIYPYTNLCIVTNGLLLRTMSDDLINTIRKYNVKIDISSYRPLWSKMDEICDFLHENKLSFRVTEPMSNFYKIADFEHRLKFPYKTLTELPTCKCKNLRKGKIAICPIVCYSEFYDKYYRTNKMKKNCTKGFVDIYKIKDFSDLNEKINSPCELCDFCLTYRAPEDTDLQEKWKQLKEN